MVKNYADANGSKILAIGQWMMLPLNFGVTLRSMAILHYFSTSLYMNVNLILKKFLHIPEYPKNAVRIRNTALHKKRHHHRRGRFNDMSLFFSSDQRKQCSYNTIYY